MSKIAPYDTDDSPYQVNEEVAMKYVYERTTIPVPRVYHVLKDPSGALDVHIAMDYIPGERLNLIWPKLSVWSKLRVAWILRSYVRQLRSIRDIRSRKPGPLGLKPKKCAGFIPASTEQFGPFVDSLALTAAINKQCSSYQGVPVPAEYAVAEPLFFTHNDLHMRNVILGHDGRVWLIDWEYAGFYPKSFEYATMVLFAESHPHAMDPLSWRRCLPFIADPYFGYYRWLIGYSP